MDGEERIKGRTMRGDEAKNKLENNRKEKINFSKVSSSIFFS